MIRVLFKIFTHFKADKFFTNQGFYKFPFLPYNQLHIDQLHRYNIGIDHILDHLKNDHQLNVLAFYLFSSIMLSFAWTAAATTFAMCRIGELRWKMK